MLEAEASAVNPPSHSRGGEAVQPEHDDEENEFPELEFFRRAKTHWRETTRASILVAGHELDRESIDHRASE